MSADYSPERIRRREWAVSVGMFKPTKSLSGRIACADCGERGYPKGSWMDKHIDGHVRCSCGAIRPTRGLNSHLAMSPLHPRGSVA